MKYDDIQQSAGRSILMEASFIDVWHIAEFCLSSESGLEGDHVRDRRGGQRGRWRELEDLRCMSEGKPGEEPGGELALSWEGS